VSKVLLWFRSQFQDIYWPLWTNQIRDWVISCVQNIMLCWSHDLGFATYKCPNCDAVHTQSFTCKRPICSSCSKPRCDKRINHMSTWLPSNINYLHLTFTLPEELRNFWLKYRKYWVLSVLFNQVHAIIIEFFEKHFWCKPWIFSIIHTFGSAVNRNPHIHCIVTLWWIKINDSWEFSWIDIEGKYISYKHFKSKRRTCIIKQCRKCLMDNDPESYIQRNVVFETLFMKSRYVTVSPPIIDVVRVMNYVTRYMYRPPVSLCDIVDYHNTWDIYTSTITLKFFHKKPRELRFITYTMLEFIGLLARQIPDKYYKTIRYGWIFIPQIRTKNLIILKACSHHRYAPKFYIRPKKFSQRIQESFGCNPLHCSSCNQDMILISITFFSKKIQAFTTKYFDTS